MWMTARQPSAGSLSQWNEAKVMKTNSQRNLLAIALGREHQSEPVNQTHTGNTKHIRTKIRTKENDET